MEFKDIDLGENPTLKEEVTKATVLKEWLVNYVGEKKNPTNGQVTMEMVLDVMATDFPEFLLPLAEENFIRGYHQALVDVEYGKTLSNDSSLSVTKPAAKKSTRRRKKTKKPSTKNDK